ncbi:MAG: AAA family ATPase [Victivallaceae bacterium]|nr:AAA family ATPase [Victivallaceae bacterium]
MIEIYDVDISSPQNIAEQISQYLQEIMLTNGNRYRQQRKEELVFQHYLFVRLQIEHALRQLMKNDPAKFQTIFTNSGCRLSPCDNTAIDLSMLWMVKITTNNHQLIFEDTQTRMAYHPTPLTDFYARYCSEKIQPIKSLADLFKINCNYDVATYNETYHVTFDSCKMLTIQDKSGDIKMCFSYNTAQYPAPMELIYPLWKTNFDFCQDALWPLYNLHLITENLDAAVIITDSIIQAEELQNTARRFRNQQFQVELDNFIAKTRRCWDDYETKNQQKYTKLFAAGFTQEKESGFTSPRPFPMNNIEAAGIGECLPGNIIFSAGYGDDIQNALKHSDLSPLNGRIVFYLTSERNSPQEQTAAFMQAYNGLNNAAPRDVYFIMIKDNIDPNNPMANGITVIPGHKVISDALDYGFPIDNLSDTELRKYSKIAHKEKKNDFLIDNILDRQSLLLISAPTGVGKTMFAMNLGYALATCGPLFNDWTVKQRCKVVYLADEELNPKLLGDRTKKFRKMYNSVPEISDVLFYPAQKCNLLEDSSREKIMSYLTRKAINLGTKGLSPCVIIIDSLNRLAPQAHIDKNWESLSRWFSDLQFKYDFSIILLHHSAKDIKSDYLGTSKIGNDVDVHIHLTGWSQKELSSDYPCKQDRRHIIPIKFFTKKNRRSWLDRESKRYILSWGNNPAWYGPDDDIVIWRRLTKEEKIAFIEEKRGIMTAKAMAKMCGMSPRTIEKFIYENKDEIPLINHIHGDK